MAAKWKRAVDLISPTFIFLVKGINLKVKIGITIAPYQGIKITQFLSLIRFSGFEFIEISKDIFEEIDTVLPKIGNFYTSFHLPLISENGWDFSCLDYRTEIDDLTEKLNRYQKPLKIKQYVAHPPEPHFASQPIRTCVDFLLENLGRLEQKIYIENIQGMPHAEYLQLVDKARNRLGRNWGGQCYDGPHYFLDGMDPVQMLLSLNSRVKYIHLSGCSHDRDLHQPFDAKGAFPIDAVLRTLKKVKYNGWINLEIQPKSIRNVNKVVQSYLKVLRYFRPVKYIIARIKMGFIMPIVQSRINKFVQERKAK